MDDGGSLLNIITVHHELLMLHTTFQIQVAVGDLSFGFFHETRYSNPYEGKALTTILFGALWWYQAFSAHRGDVAVVSRVILLGLGGLLPQTCTQIRHGNHIGWDGSAPDHRGDSGATPNYQISCRTVW